MSITDRAQPYVDRLLEDRELQRDLRDLGTALRGGVERVKAKRKQPKGLLGDRRFKQSAQRTVASLKDASARFQGDPPKRHRFRKFLIVVVVLGGAAFAAKRAIEAQDQPRTPA